MKPIFSIIIPVYNVAPYLRECLDSVLRQTCTDWEAICVDDGSTDDSAAILDEYAQKDKRFIIVHKSNGGAASARNTGYSSSSGSYVLFLDGDDLLPYNYLDSHLKCRGNVLECATMAGYFRMYEDGSVEYPDCSRYADFDDVSEMMKSMLSYGWCPVVHGWVWPTLAIKKSGGWRVEIESYDDIDFSYRCLQYCKHVRMTKESAAIYRKHFGGLSTMPADERFSSSIIAASDSISCVAQALDMSQEMRNSIAQLWYRHLLWPRFSRKQSARAAAFDRIRTLNNPDFYSLRAKPKQYLIYKLFGMRVLIRTVLIFDFCLEFYSKHLPYVSKIKRAVFK